MARNSTSNIRSVATSRAVELADMAAEKSQQMADAAREEASRIRALGSRAAATVGDWSNRAGDTARKGVDWVREGADDVRYSALRAVDRSAGIVRDQPLRSVFVAAVAGAAVMALINAVRRRD